ncbi:Variant surface glycoprotein [Trypanosoma congolense IL3000]|uniref:Variant surface glycoprotein n=1 Tax=Trypanosoma congolense (strain IL3000) TaxID=1068625 RepID=F9W9N8_TRYCI|nr:Variant surface glycoprotein [Trypanosoma congolense IL3000]
MWRGNVVLTLVALVLGMFAVLGNSDSGDGNVEEKELLCKVLTAAETILNNKNADGELYKDELQKAIYGDKFRAKFDRTGSVSVGGYCHTKSLRAQHCKYYTEGQRYFWGGGRDGCFSESLVGTFFCACTPGSPKSKVGDLCGVSTSEYQGGWWSSYSWKKTALFQHVWDRVIQKCTNASGNVANILAELKTLKKSVDSVKEKIKRNGKNNNFYYLGGTGQADCNANNVNEICAGYQGKGEGGLNIPWVNKIENVIHEIKKVEKEKERIPRASDTATSPQAENNAAEAARVEENDAAPLLADPIASRNHEQIREEETENQSANKSSIPDEVPKSRVKRTTTNPSLTDIPHIATNPNEGGSFLTRQKWLLFSILSN